MIEIYIIHTLTGGDSGGRCGSAVEGEEKKVDWREDGKEGVVCAISQRRRVWKRKKGIRLVGLCSVGRTASRSSSMSVRKGGKGSLWRAKWEGGGTQKWQGG